MSSYYHYYLVPKSENIRWDVKHKINNNNQHHYYIGSFFLKSVE
jgi:hypothetical protein